MKPAVLSEWRKITTVRSSFVLGGVVILITSLVAFFAYGYKASPAALGDPRFLHQSIVLSLNFVALISALVAILLVTHEYRYNTIMHTLTATKSRLNILLAKAAVTTLYAVGLTLVIIILTIGATVLGSKLQGTQMAAQNLGLGDLLGRSLFFVWGYTMFGLLLAMLIRNQVASIVSLLILPSIGEGLLSLLLRGNAKYLPFNSLTTVLNNFDSSYMSLGTTAAILTVLLYLVVGGSVAAALLYRRDAN